MLRPQSSVPQLLTLFGNRVIADVMSWDETNWRRVDLESNKAGVLRRPRKDRGVQGKRHVTTRAQTGGTQLQAASRPEHQRPAEARASIPRRAQRQGGPFLDGLRDRVALGLLGSRLSGQRLLDWKTTRLCCLSPLRSWYFVTAVLGDKSPPLSHLRCYGRGGLIVMLRKHEASKPL